MEITRIAGNTIAFQAKNKENDEKKHSKLKTALKIGVVSGGIAALTAGADLFLAKGKVISGLTGGKINFVKTMSEEIDNVVKKDNYATKSRAEAFLGTPGLHSVWFHRIAHKLYEWKVPVLPRLISNISRFLTGIEIHPGAKIGKNLFLDHTGAIIGQTAEIGNNVTIIGRTVLGSNGKGGFDRHTKVKDNVTIGMNSTMLGKIELGENSKIGAGAVVTHNVPPNATVIGNPAKITSLGNKKLESPILLSYYSKKSRINKKNEAN